MEKFLFLVLLVPVSWLPTLANAKAGDLVESNEVSASVSDNKLIRWEPVRKVSGFSGSVTVHGEGGAPLFVILGNLKRDQTPQNHADVWIIEGGLNDIKWFCDGTSESLGFWTEYETRLNQIADYAQVCGVKKLYFQEMTPVVAELVNQNPYWAEIDVPGKLPRMNEIIHHIAEEHNAGVIAVYDSFAPYWKDWSYDSSVHPNTFGADHLAEAWASGIRDSLGKNSSIYVGGDSITNAVSLTVFLEKLARLFPNAVRNNWSLYE